MKLGNEEVLTNLDRVPGRWFVAALAGLLLIVTCQQFQLHALRENLEETDGIARDAYDMAEKAKQAAGDAQDDADHARRMAELNSP